jgi:hypothetical protein
LDVGVLEADGAAVGRLHDGYEVLESPTKRIGKVGCKIRGIVSPCAVCNDAGLVALMEHYRAVKL